MRKGRSKADVENALCAKGFKRARQTDHNYFIYHDTSNRKTRVKTKTSFGRTPRDITGDLLGHMARQCGLSNAQFLRFVDCPLTREDYEQLLKDKGEL